MRTGVRAMNESDGWNPVGVKMNDLSSFTTGTELIEKQKFH